MSSSFLIRLPLCFTFLFFFNDTATTEIYTLSLHDALPIFHISLSSARGRSLQKALVSWALRNRSGLELVTTRFAGLLLQIRNDVPARRGLEHSNRHPGVGNELAGIGQPPSEIVGRPDQIGAA